MKVSFLSCWPAWTWERAVPATFGNATISIAGMARSYGARLSLFVVPACGNGKTASTVFRNPQSSSLPPRPAQAELGALIAGAPGQGCFIGGDGRCRLPAGQIAVTHLAQGVNMGR